MSDKMPWLRLYSEAIDDEKLRLLAFEDRWHYVALLCCKGQGILDEANVSLMHRKVAVKLGVQVRELEEIARRLSEVGLIDEETLQPCGWCKRQFESDNSTGRVRRFRENKKNQSLNEAKQDETLQKRNETVSVTPPDTDTDTEDKSVVTQHLSESADSDRGTVLNLRSPIPDCPHHDIIAVYQDTLPELPGVILSRWPDSSGARDLKARWREDPRHRDLKFWRRFFAAVRDNPHWMGCNDRGWQADLRWLLKRSNFDKVLDRLVTVREVAHG